MDSEELALEIEARKTDIERTIERIEIMERSLEEANFTVTTTTVEIEEIERQLLNRARLLYRLSRNGGAIRYLFEAKNAIGFLKRMMMLQNLVVDDLEKRRDVGRKLQDARSDVDNLKTEILGAQQMLAQLEQAHIDLLAEQARTDTEPDSDPLN